jgi:hypothetical protein
MTRHFVSASVLQRRVREVADAMQIRSAQLRGRARRLVARAAALPPRRAWAIAVLLGASLTSALRCQVAPSDSPLPIPLAPDGNRRFDIEQQLGGGAIVFQWDSPMEMMTRYYISHFGGDRDAKLDSSKVHGGQTSSVSYHVTYYTVADQCGDSGWTTGDPCHYWRRGKDLHEVLTRRAYYTPGIWVQGVTFTWYSRDANGVLTRWTAKLVDSGLSDDWRTYLPNTQLVIQHEQIQS